MGNEEFDPTQLIVFGGILILLAVLIAVGWLLDRKKKSAVRSWSQEEEARRKRDFIFTLYKITGGQQQPISKGKLSRQLGWDSHAFQNVLDFWIDQKCVAIVDEPPREKWNEEKKQNEQLPPRPEKQKIRLTADGQTAVRDAQRGKPLRAPATGDTITIVGSQVGSIIKDSEQLDVSVRQVSTPDREVILAAITASQRALDEHPRALPVDQRLDAYELLDRANAALSEGSDQKAVTALRALKPILIGAASESLYQAATEAISHLT